MVEHNFLRRLAVNVWCGLVSERLAIDLIWPYEGNLNGNTYPELLPTQLPLLPEEIPLTRRLNFWFQHDGAPPHSAGLVMERKTCGTKKIANNGPVYWPDAPRLFLCGWMKTQVCTTKSSTREVLMMERVVLVLWGTTLELFKQKQTRWMGEHGDAGRNGGHLDNFLSGS